MIPILLTLAVGFLLGSALRRPWSVGPLLDVAPEPVCEPERPEWLPDTRWSRTQKEVRA